MFRKVTHAIKHKQRNEIYEVLLESGRSIKVTGCHSVFSLDKHLNIQDVEARDLKVGNHLIVPKKIPEPEIIDHINIIDYLSHRAAKKRYWYVYGFSQRQIKEVFSKGKVIHKKTSKSRKFYRFIKTDVLDDSYKQYLKKGFLPLHLVKQLNIKTTEQNYIRTYYHGEEHRMPLYWKLTPQLMRFLGFFVAEGHTDERQVGFTFSRAEKGFVKEVSDFAL
jgi:DNA topoisomerase-6 subunit B